MSSLYNLEPQPTARVLLQTTAGDIFLELFAKQTPLASRNFLQLCLDGYYDDTTFFRLVPNFIIQGGDPTGTGSGGESSYDGEPFADEFHTRLRFNRRGLLGMANTGRKNDNGSQFFLTLDKAEELNGKNTLFGRVVETIYTLLEMGEAELADAESDRPLYPVRITGTEILVNPFDDMVKRTKTAHPAAEMKQDNKKPKKKAGKQLLSFGGEDGEDDIGVPVAKKAKFNPKLVSGGQGAQAPEAGSKMPELASASHKRGSLPAGPDKNSESPANKHVSTSPSASPLPRRDGVQTAAPSKPAPSPSPPQTPEPVEKMSSLLEKTNAQIAQLKASMRRNVCSTPMATPRKKSALQAMIPKTSIQGRKRKLGSTTGSAVDDQRALDMFNAFKTKLDTVSTAAAPLTSTAEGKPLDSKPSRTTDTADAELFDDEAALCDLHFIANCQSCSAWSASLDFTSGIVDAAGDNDQGTNWMSHALTFARDRLGKDQEWKRKNEEELVVIDPREKARELKVEERRRRDEIGRMGRPVGHGVVEKERDKGKVGGGLTKR